MCHVQVAVTISLLWTQNNNKHNVWGKAFLKKKKNFFFFTKHQRMCCAVATRETDRGMTDLVLALASLHHMDTLGVDQRLLGQTLPKRGLRDQQSSKCCKSSTHTQFSNRRGKNTGCHEI